MAVRKENSQRKDIEDENRRRGNYTVGEREWSDLNCSYTSCLCCSSNMKEEQVINSTIMGYILEKANRGATGNLSKLHK